MTVLRREDGAVFVLQPYRESLSLRNTSLLKKEIRHLAEMHGDNVRLFRHENGFTKYEGVFSRDTGYLLGENVWHHFEEPEQLIYCEAVNEQQVLLVIVRDGEVYLDNKLSLEELHDELTALATHEGQQYDIYVYGKNVPFEFDEAKIKSLTHLDEPIFAQLVITDAYRLLSLEQALDEFHLGKAQQTSSLALIAFAILIVLGGWVYYSSSSQSSPEQTLTPYEMYQQALQTPDPGQQLSALMVGLEKIYGIDGWYAASMNYDGNSVQVQMHSLGGMATALLNWSQQNNMSLNLSSQGAMLNFATNINNRPKPNHMVSAQQTAALIIDRMMMLLPGRSVSIGNGVSNQGYNSLSVTISFSDISPEILQLIGSNLDDLPVNLVSCQANIENGLLSGSLQLKVMGS